MKLQGPHAHARLSLPPALRAPPLAAAARKLPGFCPEFLARRDAALVLDAAAVCALATQVTRAAHEDLFTEKRLLTEIKSLCKKEYLNSHPSSAVQDEARDAYQHGGSSAVSLCLPLRRFLWAHAHNALA